MLEIAAIIYALTNIAGGVMLFTDDPCPRKELHDLRLIVSTIPDGTVKACYVEAENVLIIIDEQNDLHYVGVPKSEI